MGALKGKKKAGNPKLNGAKIKKDLGVPNLQKFKDKKLLKEQNKKKAALERHMAKNKSKPSSTMNVKVEADLDVDEEMMLDAPSLMDMVRNAETRSNAFDEQEPILEVDKTQQDAAATGHKDNSRKAYYREFRKVLENADVVLEILDARDPIGTRTHQVERLIMDSGVSKKVILVLNKIDLVPKENVDKWLKYLRNEYPTIAFKASTQNQRRNLGHSSVATDAATEDLLKSSECLGADMLVSLLKNYCRSVNMKTSITVGIIGYPNVGKSSVINSLKRSKVCGVGSTPGFTKVAQQITLDKNIKLLDCPGIVFAQQGQDGRTDAEIALRNCIKVELLEDPITPVEVIVARCPKEQLMTMYDVPYFENANEFLTLLAQKWGKLRKGGISDTHLVARTVLNDWNGGKIKFWTEPPAADKSHIGASVVSSWGEALDMNLK